MKSERKVGMCISAVLVVCTLVLYYVRVKESYNVSALLMKLSEGMQSRQIVVACVLFLIGYIVTCCMSLDMGTYGRIGFSYVLGIVLWGSVSVFFLCSGIPYNLYSMLIALCCILALSIVFGGREMKGKMRVLVQDLVIFVGIAAIASAGLFFVFTSGDSQYFILEWGKSIAIEHGIDSTHAHYLANTGIFAASLSSLAYFVRVDNIYTIHYCLIICWALFIGSVLYKDISYLSKGKRGFVSAALTLLMLTLPPIQLIAGWIISNSYMMVYLFVFGYFMKYAMESERVPVAKKIILCLLVISLTLMRSDSAITMGVVLGCFAIYYRDKIEAVRIYIIVSFLAFVLYYAKIYTIIDGHFDSTLISMSTLGMIGLLYGIVLVYSFAAKYLLKKVKHENLLYVAMLVFNVGLLLYFRGDYMTNISNIIKNMTTIDQHWGSTFSIVCLCIVMHLFRRYNNVLFMIWVCLMITYVDLGVLRTLSEMAPGVARLGFGDSMNRAIISILPILIYSSIKMFSNCYVIMDEA